MLFSSFGCRNLPFGRSPADWGDFVRACPKTLLSPLPRRVLRRALKDKFHGSPLRRSGKLQHRPLASTGQSAEIRYLFTCVNAVLVESYGSAEFFGHTGHAVTNSRKEIAAFFESARTLRRDPYYPHVAVASPVGFRKGYYCYPATHNRWLTLGESAKGDLQYDDLVSHGSPDDFTHWRLEHKTVNLSGTAVEAINRGDNRIVVTTQNVIRFTVWLHPRMADLSKSVTIVVDGHSAFSGRLHASLATALESYERRGDWGLIYPIKVELVKDKSGSFRPPASIPAESDSH